MITDVAIQWNGSTYSMAAPARHADLIREIIKKTGGINGPHTEGFLMTPDGRSEESETKMFLDRRAAYLYAQTKGQILPNANVKNNTLYSEDLW